MGTPMISRTGTMDDITHKVIRFIEYFYIQITFLCVFLLLIHRNADILYRFILKLSMSFYLLCSCQSYTFIFGIVHEL